MNRNCPECNILIDYKNKRKLSNAIKNNSLCRSCCKNGNKNPMYGVFGEDHPTFGWVGLVGDKNPSKRKEVRDKISKAKKGKQTTSMLGKHHSDESKEKSRKSNFGQKRSDITKDKIREKRKLQIGDKCPSWKGGITPIIQKLRNSDEYKEWRKKVYLRDNYTCCKCNKRGVILNAHHVIGVYIKQDMIFDLNNGITLCKGCHKQFHKEYGMKNFPLIWSVWIPYS